MLHLLDQQDGTLRPMPDQSPPLMAHHHGEQGISPDQILNVASLLDCYAPVNVESNLVNSWVWEASHFQGLPLMDNLDTTLHDDGQHRP
jgi:hypothetical protein